ncbi:hypothetical protein ACFRQM_42260 [Streptomyces sp. NPDC056831]|uniref:hypothetical protein n=1 Tax=Streptomyces sp. NPDC056831 TaxID=3345954 RepID=UPI003696FD42
MIVIWGLIILIAAVVVAVAGVLTNAGSAHQLTDGFSLFGYHVTGSTGTLFLYGIAVGALAFLGLSLLIAAARRPSHHSRTSRRAHGQPSREPPQITATQSVTTRPTARRQHLRGEATDPTTTALSPPTAATGAGGICSGTGPPPDNPGHTQQIADRPTAADACWSGPGQRTHALPARPRSPAARPRRMKPAGSATTSTKSPTRRPAFRSHLIW